VLSFEKKSSKIVSACKAGRVDVIDRNFPKGLSFVGMNAVSETINTEQG
jgi:hypothetical protein